MYKIPVTSIINNNPDKNRIILMIIIIIIINCGKFKQIIKVIIIFLPLKMRLHFTFKIIYILRGCKWFVWLN